MIVKQKKMKMMRKKIPSHLQRPVVTTTVARHRPVVTTTVARHQQQLRLLLVMVTTRLLGTTGLGTVNVRLLPTVHELV